MYSHLCETQQTLTICDVSADFPGGGQSGLVSALDKFLQRVSNPPPGISRLAWEGPSQGYGIGKKKNNLGEAVISQDSVFFSFKFHS